ncbi:MAG: hypothetical protein A2X49_11995 [Lentisphaerae bacterium GWF2_52_8]|nr:MAG: hypothetical protein A2X49_11995 [Lentisphaerae bacterium GWF2_52_8]
MEELSFVKLILFLFLLSLVFGLFWHLRRRRRAAILSSPFRPEWEEAIIRNLSLYTAMPENLRERLKKLIGIFLDEKNFEACGGLVMNDEIRVTVAAQACLLLLNERSDFFPLLNTILVYPSEYNAPEDGFVGGVYVRDEEDAAHLGDSWSSGAIILAWDRAKRGPEDIRDGVNVVVHEFAHQLDQEDGAVNGVPRLNDNLLKRRWATVMEREYARLRTNARRRRPDVLDEYGSSEPAEFFAVATEAFFERPVRLKRSHSELYELLKDYYQLDPASWDWPQEALASQHWERGLLMEEEREG